MSKKQVRVFFTDPKPTAASPKPRSRTYVDVTSTTILGQHALQIVCEPGPASKDPIVEAVIPFDRIDHYDILDG